MLFAAVPSCAIFPPFVDEHTKTWRRQCPIRRELARTKWSNATVRRPHATSRSQFDDSFRRRALRSSGAARRFLPAGRVISLGKIDYYEPCFAPPTPPQSVHPCNAQWGRNATELAF